MDSGDDTIRPDELLAQLGWVRALAARLVADPEVTDDVLQQVCLLALQQAPRDARAGPRLRAWLATVTRHLARHAARSDARRTRREQAAARPEALPSTADIASHREALRKLVDAVTSLDEPYYSVVVARYLDGRSVAEIAALTGASATAVRQQLSRARLKLRARLQSLLADEPRSWLTAALPLAPVAASLKGAPARSFIHSGGLFMAKSVPLLATAIGIAVVGTFLLLRADQTVSDSAPVVVQALPEVANPDHFVVHDSALHEPAEPLRAHDAVAVEAAPAPAPPSIADRLALPSVPASKAWDGLFQAADALAYGTFTQAELVDLSFALLAQLPADATPQFSYGYATFDLLETPGMGKVQLVMDLQAPKEAAGQPMRASAFTIAATLDTRPGAYTGNLADNATATRLDISVRADERDVLQGVSAMSQNVMGGSKELWSQMNADGRAVAIGGVLSITNESSTWRPFNVQATSGTAGETGFLNTMGEPVDRAGAIADPRTQLLNDVLTDRRKSVPRPR